MKMQLNNELKELLKGKGTEIKKKVFLPTEEYVVPFLEAVENITQDIRVQTVMPKQITYSDSKDLTYNRVWLQAVLPETIHNHRQVIGMIYGLDAKGAPMKFYKGQLNMACTNLSVFNPEALYMQELESNKDPMFGPLRDLINKEFREMEILNHLKDERFHKADAADHLQTWMDHVLKSKTNFIKPTDVVNAYNELMHKQGGKYIIEGSDSDMFNVYNAFTQQLTNSKAFINRGEATLAIADMMDLGSKIDLNL